MAAMIAISEDIAKPAPAVTVILQPSDGFSAPSAQLENKNTVNFTAISKSKTWISRYLVVHYSNSKTKESRIYLATE